MIKVFNADERVFTNNGEKILKPLKAVILKEDNGDYELELETRIEDKDYIVKDKIIVCDTPWGEQGFRIDNPQKKSNKITCTCKHLFYDTAFYLIADAYVVDKTCNEALDHLNNACDVTTPFTTISDIQTLNTCRIVRKSFEEAISTVLERWGGHLVRDNFNVAIMSDIGRDNGVTLRYGKNIKDIQVKEDWSNVVTKILPVGKDGLTLDNIYISTNDLDSSEKNYGLSYDKPYTKSITFSQEIDEEALKEVYTKNGTLDEEAYAEALKIALIDDLREQALDYIRVNCVPKINYSVKANINNVTDVGDTIEVYDERLNVNLITKVISVKWDCLQERYTEVNFGNFSNKLKNLVTTTTVTAKKEIKNTVDTEVVPEVTKQVKEAFNNIWSAFDKSYCVYDGDQLLVVDELPKEKAKNCLRINRFGISLSKDGLNGKFDSVLKTDGTFNIGYLGVFNGEDKVLWVNDETICVQNLLSISGFNIGETLETATPICESGETPNGKYIKFYDGTMLCWDTRQTVNQTINEEYGSIFVGTREITYPCAFAKEPTLTCTAFAWGTSNSWGSVAKNASPLTKGTLKGYDCYSRDEGTSCDIGWVAVGKWK